jgi:hypothetical protein
MVPPTGCSKRRPKPSRSSNKSSNSSPPFTVRHSTCGWEASARRRWWVSSRSSTSKSRSFESSSAGSDACWTPCTVLMGASENRTHYFFSFFCSTVAFWCEESVPPRRDTQGMTHKSLHPEPEVFRTVRPLSQSRTGSGKEHTANRVRWSLVIQLVSWEVA